RHRRDVRMNLPARRSAHEGRPARVMVLHVDDRHSGRAGTAHELADAGHGTRALVAHVHERDLQVDDEQRGIHQALYRMRGSRYPYRRSTARLIAMNITAMNRTGDCVSG